MHAVYEEVSCVKREELEREKATATPAGSFGGNSACQGCTWQGSSQVTPVRNHLLAPAFLDHFWCTCCSGMRTGRWRLGSWSVSWKEAGGSKTWQTEPEAEHKLEKDTAEPWGSSADISQDSYTLLSILTRVNLLEFSSLRSAATYHLSCYLKRTSTKPCR